MPVHNSGRVVLHCAQADETLAQQFLARIGHAEFLEIRVKAWLGLARQDALIDPLVQMARGARVDIVGGGIRVLALAENDAYEVVRTQRQVTRPHGRRDLVVRLRNQLLEWTGFRSIAIGLEGKNCCHVNGKFQHSTAQLCRSQ